MKVLRTFQVWGGVAMIGFMALALLTTVIALVITFAQIVFPLSAVVQIFSPIVLVPPIAVMLLGVAMSFCVFTIGFLGRELAYS